MVQTIVVATRSTAGGGKVVRLEEGYPGVDEGPRDEKDHSIYLLAVAILSYFFTFKSRKKVIEGQALILVLVSIDKSIQSIFQVGSVWRRG